MSHSIENTVLHEIVLRSLQEAIKLVSPYEAEFVKARRKALPQA